MLVFLLIQLSSVSSASLNIRYPQFFHQSPDDLSVEITEGKSTGSFIAFINLLNTNEPSVLDDWIVNTTDGDFQVISNGFSLSLINSQPLDRERQHFYEFFINAHHRKYPYEQLSKSVRLRILDINDCSPTFNQTVYHVNVTNDNCYYRMHAIDNDQTETENSRISYSLANYLDLFQIDQTTGLIECLRNFTISERFDLIVTARDHGKPSLSSTTLVQIQTFISLTRETNEAVKKPITWILSEQKPEKMLILAGILAAIFVFFSLLTCLICSIHYKIQRKKHDESLTTSPDEEKKHYLDSEADRPEGIVHDAFHLFPNTYYIPLEDSHELLKTLTHNDGNEILFHLCQTPSSTSSPILTMDAGVKTGSDDGCYCSSDMSSDQSNQFVLLDPSSLTLATNQKYISEPIRSHQQYINGILKRFEHLYEPAVHPQDSRASYV